MEKKGNNSKPRFELISDNTTKQKNIRPLTVSVTKRPHSMSPAAQRTRTRSPITVKKLAGERRCQSLSPLKIVAKNTFPVPKLQCASVPIASDNTAKQSEAGSVKPDLPKDLPHFVVSKITRAIATKKREFIKLRKALIPQQNVVIEQYANLKELESRIGAHGEEGIGDLRVLSFSKWPAHDLLLLVKNDLDVSNSTVVSGVLGSQVMHQLQNTLSEIPEDIYELATELMARRIDVLTLLRNKMGFERAASALHPEWRTKNVDQETEQLHCKVSEMVENVKMKITHAFDLAKIPWLDREDMIKKIERLQNENLRIHNQLTTDANETKENSDDSKQQSKLTDKCAPFQMQNICEELQKERSAREALKGVVSNAENLLRVARARIATLERQVAEARAQHDATIRKQRDIDLILRQRESTYDARTKKLHEVSKSSEASILALSRQRDALELRVRELLGQMDQQGRELEEKHAKERSRADSLQAKVAVQEKNIEAAGKRVEELQSVVKELEEKHRVLQEHSVRLVEAERKRCLEYLPTKENEPSLRETDIWKELQATKTALSRAKEELHNCRVDKDSFLNSLSRIAEGERPDSLEEKMSIELLEKEKTISNLRMILDTYQKNEKIMERSMTQYENDIVDLKLEVKRLRNYDCFTGEVKLQDLQTELLDLHMKVECLTRERSALVSAAASRALMLERHERAAELFASVTRARREITAHLDGDEEPPTVNETVYAEVSRSLSSVCASAADSWSALRSERARVLRLERAVLSQSFQLEREGAARTRLEDRRAQLERALALQGHSGAAPGAGSEPTVVLKLPSSVNYKGKCFVLNTGG